MTSSSCGRYKGPGIQRISSCASCRARGERRRCSATRRGLRASDASRAAARFKFARPRPRLLGGPSTTGGGCPEDGPEADAHRDAPCGVPPSGQARGPPKPARAGLEGALLAQMAAGRSHGRSVQQSRWRRRALTRRHCGDAQGGAQLGADAENENSSCTARRAGGAKAQACAATAFPGWSRQRRHPRAERRGGRPGRALAARARLGRLSTGHASPLASWGWCTHFG